MDIDARSAIRNIVVALIGVGLVVLVIVLIIKGFTGGSDRPTNRVNVTKYAYSASIATLLVDGPTNIDQDHRQIRISVSATQNEIDIIQGYQGNVIKSKTYPNNNAAYSVFLQSLQLLNFSKGIKSTVNYQGFCPTGNRFVYSFTDSQDELFSYWSTSCGGAGTFKGNAMGVRSLFQRQIPTQDINTLTSGTNVGL